MYKPPYIITDKSIMVLSEISVKLGEVHSYKSLERLPHLRKQNRVKSIYSSCAIEANSLSLNEVKDIINGKEVIGDKNEILEIKNAINAYELIDQIDPYNMDSLFEIHKILTKDLIEQSGKFRNNPEGVSDGNKIIFVAPPSSLVPKLMNDLYDFINYYKNEIHPIILSSIFHYEFVFIHPFQDGNGRLARFMQTALLGDYNNLFYWLPIENEIKDNQTEYYNVINECNINGNSTLFIEFMLELINKTLDKAILEINKETVKKSIYVQKLMDVMSVNEPLTANELLERLNLKSKETLRKNYLNPAIEANLIELEIKDKPTSKNQRYIRK